MACIIANTLVLAIKFYNMSEELTIAIEYVNYVFMAIFTIEAIIKIIAMKTKYFYDAWNIFDFIVVVGTLIILILTFT